MARFALPRVACYETRPDLQASRHPARAELARHYPCFWTLRMTDSSTSSVRFCSMRAAGLHPTVLLVVRGLWPAKLASVHFGSNDCMP
jgi:hypothetical protein